MHPEVPQGPRSRKGMIRGIARMPIFNDPVNRGSASGSSIISGGWAFMSPSRSRERFQFVFAVVFAVKSKIGCHHREIQTKLISLCDSPREVVSRLQGGVLAPVINWRKDIDAV
jgi:hypothetical protein